MRKLICLILVTFLSGCVEPPPKSVNLEFEGEWKGRRINENNNPICSPTAMFGTIENGEASFTLGYNNTVLKGTVNEWGHMVLKDDNPMWVYHFNGTAKQSRIEGRWSVENATCAGEWYLERVSEKQKG